MRRRVLFALPLLAVVPLAAGWRGQVSEIRFGAGAAAASAGRLGAILGLPVTAVELAGEALVRAFVDGQLECAAVSRPDADWIEALAGPRVLRQGRFMILRTLPPGLRDDLLGALRSI